MNEVFQLQDTIRSKYNVSLDLDKPNDKPKMVHADRQRIIEVLNNLIVNSIVYGKKGGRTRVMIEETGDSIFVSISDDGIGINEEEIPRIFERFYRTDKSRSRNSGGTGLGLAISRQLVELMGGHIEANSRFGEGSTFSFTFP